MSSRLVASLSACLLASACGGGNTASQLAKAPEFAPKDQSKCGVTKSQARPLVVEWPSADRAALELSAKRGLVVVKYAGCEMEVLRQCKAPGAYGYTAITRKDDHISIKDQDDLYASIPVYAAKFEGKLQKAGELAVNMTIVGAYETDRTVVRPEELVGECAGATHVITALTTGAFEFFAGASAEVGGGATVGGMGGGAKSTSGREMLNRDGDKAACDRATSKDKEPPDGCGALLRVEVVALAAPVPGPLESGLVASFGFAEQKGAQAADAHGGLTGKLLNGASWSHAIPTAPGITGALEFDGVDDGFVVNRAAALEPPGSLTVALWGFITDARAGAFANLVRKADGDSVGYLLRWSHRDGRLQLRLDRKGAPGLAAVDARPNSSYLNAWHHYAASYDSTTGAGRLYVDGALAGSADGPPTPLQHSGSFYLMNGPFDSQSAVPGRVAGVRVYGRALPASDVASLARRP